MTGRFVRQPPILALSMADELDSFLHSSGCVCESSIRFVESLGLAKLVLFALVTDAFFLARTDNIAATPDNTDTESSTIIILMRKACQLSTNARDNEHSIHLQATSICTSVSCERERYFVVELPTSRISGRLITYRRRYCVLDPDGTLTLKSQPRHMHGLHGTTLPKTERSSTGWH